MVSIVGCHFKQKITTFLTFRLVQHIKMSKVNLRMKGLMLKWPMSLAAASFVFGFQRCVHARLMQVGSYQSSSVPRPVQSSGGPDGRFNRDPLPVFSVGGRRQQF